MNKIIKIKSLVGSWALIAALTAAVWGTAVAANNSSHREGALPDQYIVVLKDGQDSDLVASELAQSQGLGLGHVYKYALRGFSATIPAARLNAIKNDPRVEYISEDREVSIFAQTLPTGVRRVGAEQTATHTNKGTGVNVAIIDTGIDLKHPDLKANIVGGKNCSTGRYYSDGNGHGTHVAGTVAALDNSIGVLGVAPEAKLWSVRVLNNAGSGTWSSVICGVDFVTSNAPANGGPIAVANMSLGGPGSSDNNCGNSNNDALHQAICNSTRAGVTYVVASGNGSADASTFVPAAYDDTVITVSALADSDGLSGGVGSATSYGADDTFASFSNYGSLVDLGAPGVGILSTWKGSSYNTISGTSMASPHVAGAAALYVKNNPGSTWTAVRDGLKALAETLGAGHTDPSGLHPEPVVKVDSL